MAWYKKWDFTTDDRCMGETLCDRTVQQCGSWDSWMYPYPRTPMGIHSISPIYWVFLPKEFPRKLSLEISGQFSEVENMFQSLSFAGE